MFDDNGVPITLGASLKMGDTLHVRFADATVDAAVLGVRESE